MPITHRNKTGYTDYPRLFLFLLLWGMLAGAAWQYRNATDNEIGYHIRQGYYEVTHQLANLRSLLPGA